VEEGEERITVFLRRQLPKPESPWSYALAKEKQPDKDYSLMKRTATAAETEERQGMLAILRKSRNRVRRFWKVLRYCIRSAKKGGRRSKGEGANKSPNTAYAFASY